MVIWLLPRFTHWGKQFWRIAIPYFRPDRRVASWRPLLTLLAMLWMTVLAVRPMPLSLAGDLVEVDLGWAVVELAVVGGAFEAVVVSAVSFDHPGVCSVSSRGVGSAGDFVGGFGECGGECFRGKSPPGW